MTVAQTNTPTTKTEIRFVDLHKQYQELGSEIDQAVKSVMNSWRIYFRT